MLSIPPALQAQFEECLRNKGFVCVCRTSVASGWRIFMLKGDEMPRPMMVRLLQSEVI
jgi:hypothetical protein